MMEMSQTGSIDEIYLVSEYLKIKHNAEIVFDPRKPYIDHSRFVEQDWTSTVYGQIKEELFADAPNSCGLGLSIQAFAHADHTINLVNRHSRTGFIIFLKNKPIYQCSKKQFGINDISFDSEFIAMKLYYEYLHRLNFMLRSMEVTVDAPCVIYSTNKSMLVIGLQPFSVLKKESNSIAFHMVRGGVDRDKRKLTYINSDVNILICSLIPYLVNQKKTCVILHHM